MILVLIFLQLLANFLFLKFASNVIWKVFSLFAIFIFPAIIIFLVLLPLFAMSPDVVAFSADKNLIIQLGIMILVPFLIQIFINLKAEKLKQMLSSRK